MFSRQNTISGQKISTIHVLKGDNYNTLIITHISVLNTLIFEIKLDLGHAV